MPTKKLYSFIRLWSYLIWSLELPEYLCTLYDWLLQIVAPTWKNLAWKTKHLTSWPEPRPARISSRRSYAGPSTIATPFQSMLSDSVSSSSNVRPNVASLLLSTWVELSSYFNAPPSFEWTALHAVQLLKQYPSGVSRCVLLTGERCIPSSYPSPSPLLLFEHPRAGEQMANMSKARGTLWKVETGDIDNAVDHKWHYNRSYHENRPF